MRKQEETGSCSVPDFMAIIVLLKVTFGVCTLVNAFKSYIPEKPLVLLINLMS